MSAARQPLPVVCALIRDGSGRLLVAQRPLYKHLGGKWEFPGGKVEPGEAPEAALVREIREELGCDISLQAMVALPHHVHDYGDRLIELIPLIVPLLPGDMAPVAYEHTALRWAEPTEILRMDLAPADQVVADSYARNNAAETAKQR